MDGILAFEEQDDVHHPGGIDNPAVEQGPGDNAGSQRSG